MTKATGKGRGDNAPRKLKVGDAVVFQPKQSKTGIWYKGEIKYIYDSWYLVACTELGMNICAGFNSFYVIRSTARDTYQQYKFEQKRAEKRKVERELAEIQKQQRRESLGKFGSSSK